MRLLLALVVVSSLASTPAIAQIYRWVDKEGNVVFSDVPPPTDHGAQVDLQPVNSFTPPAPAAAPTEAASATATLDAQYYELLQIVEPTNDAAVRENAGNLVVSVALSPELRGDHRLRLTIDGTPVAAQASDRNVFTLSNVDRGTHAVAAEVVDSTGSTIKSSPPVTFHMLRVAAGRPAPAPLAKPKPAG